MMILPLADSLQNCLQNLTSRIAGVDNEQMTNRVVGMGAMLGFSIGAIKEQFNPPPQRYNTNTNNLGHINSNSTNSGFKGFIDRAKAVVTPSMNLSDEKDYNGNINPIRNVLQKETTNINTGSNVNNNISIPTSNGINKEGISTGIVNRPKSIAGRVAKTGFKATKAYLSVGAKMAEGDFSKSPLQNNSYPQNIKKNNYKNTEYIQNMKTMQKLSTENIEKKLGDANEPKEKF